MTQEELFLRCYRVTQHDLVASKLTRILSYLIGQTKTDYAAYPAVYLVWEKLLDMHFIRAYL